MTDELTRLREALWRELIEKDDRTSPTEYPDMALITREELLAMFDQIAALALPAEKAEPVAENDKAREIAKLLALAGLAVDRFRGSIPNDSWKPHEWCERILECIPQREVEHCLATAHQIARNFCSAAPLPASPASDAMREAVAWRCASEGDVQVEIVTDPHAARAYQAAGGWKVTPLYASPPAPEAEKLREALRLMLAHSCVADAGPDMKSEEDHAAERAARAALKEKAP